MNENKGVLFFAYGSLKQGFWNNYLFDNAEKWGAAKTEPKYTMFDGNFPIVERDGEDTIYGELYRLYDEDEIQSVFDLERCSSQIQGDPKNWFDFDKINTKYGEAIIFVVDKEKSGRKVTLKNGQWK